MPLVLATAEKVSAFEVSFSATVTGLEEKTGASLAPAAIRMVKFCSVTTKEETESVTVTAKV